MNHGDTARHGRNQNGACQCLIVTVPFLRSWIVPEMEGNGIWFPVKGQKVVPAPRSVPEATAGRTLP